MTVRFTCAIKLIKVTSCTSALFTICSAILIEQANAGSYTGKMPGNSGTISIICSNINGVASGVTSYLPNFLIKNVQKTYTTVADRFVPDVSPQTYTERNKRVFASIRSTRPAQEQYRINGTIRSLGTNAKGEPVIGTNSFAARISCDPLPKPDYIAQPGDPNYTPANDPNIPIRCPGGTYPWGPNGECITSGPSALLYSSPDNIVASSSGQFDSDIPVQSQADQFPNLPAWKGIKWEGGNIDG